jgi:hypothetical protein
MGFTVYPPGSRKGNRRWLARVYIGAEEWEFVLEEANDRRAARHLAGKFEAAKRLGHPVPASLPPKTFAEIAARYRAARRPGRDQRRYIARLEDLLGPRPVAGLTAADIHAAAHALYPTAKAATKNRQAVNPAAAILHFGAENWPTLCPYLILRRLKEAEPERPRPSPEAIAALLRAAEGDIEDWLILVLHQGWRVSETLSLRVRHLRLADRQADVWIPKSRAWKAIELHARTRAMLRRRVKNLDPDDCVFPWRRRQRLYDDLKPVCRAAGVTFTPHMARRLFAGDLDQALVTPRGIKDAGTWLSEKSIAVYIASDARHARRVIGLLPARKAAKTRGNTRGKHRKSS